MDFTVRQAGPGDAADLARLQVVGSDGVISAIYDGLIPGLSVAEMIERRFFFRNSTKSYHNCWVAESNGKVIGDLHAHAFDAMDDDPTDPIVPEERYAVGEPFGHLDHAAVGTFHINILAVYPEFQGRGVGSALLKLAQAEAIKQGFDAISLVCFEENVDAMKLYTNRGFKEAARRAAVEHPLMHHGGDLLMLVGPV